MSPISNQRPESDPYSGHSFETRVKLLLEVTRLVRSIIPETMPLFVRISGSDFMDHEGSGVSNSWTVADTVRLAPLLEEAGVDLLDVSGGGVHLNQRIPNRGQPGYQSFMSRAAKKGLLQTGKGKMLIGAVGGIITGKLADSLLEEVEGEDGVDLIIAGRAFQKNPGLVWAWAEELGADIQLANQIGWPVKGRHHAVVKK
jgi:2,4-dienoyl-CoA reductase-like NADH-dependent reductase (Old Yellow Enzyme family)